MAWIDITYDGSVKFFSVAESVLKIKEEFFAFWNNFSGAIISFMIIIFISLLIYGIITGIKNILKEVDSL